MKTKYVTRDEIPDDAVFGCLVADLEHRIGSIAIVPDHRFETELSPMEQADLITDWIGLLYDLKQLVEHKARGSIQ